MTESSQPLAEVEFVVFDTETSIGLPPGDHKPHVDLVEIGCIVWRQRDDKQEKYNSLVKPYYPFNRQSCVSPHITEELLQKVVNFSAMYTNLEGFFGGREMVGHHTHFDQTVVARALDIYQIESPLREKMKQNSFDTQRVFHQLHPDIRERSLDAIAKAMEVPTEWVQRHNALADAQLTLEVFKKLVQEAQNKEVKSLSDFYLFQEGLFGKPAQDSLF